MTYVYTKSWMPEGEHNSTEEAAQRTSMPNGDPTLASFFTHDELMILEEALYNNEGYAQEFGKNEIGFDLHDVHALQDKFGFGHTYPEEEQNVRTRT
jgi:hypothetical protein